MTRDPHDVVKVASGEIVQIQMYQQALTEAGIESKVVGLALEASFGSALSNSIELWVNQADAEKAIAAIRLYEDEKGQKESHHKHSHPKNDPKPGQVTHGKEPHVKQDPLGE